MLLNLNKHKLNEHLDVPQNNLQQIICSISCFYRLCYDILVYLLTAFPPLHHVLSWFVLGFEVCSTDDLVGS